MGSSILKISTGLRSVFTTPNPLRGVCRMVSNSSSISRFSFINSDDQSQVSCFSASLPPWLMLSPRSQDTTYKLYNFAENKVLVIAKPDLKEEYEATKIFGSSHGWLACNNHLRGGVFLLNPLTGRRVNLPSIENLPEIPEYNFKHGAGGITKISISCSDPESEECRVMMSFGWVKRLAFCCPGRRSSYQWTVIGSEKERSYEDFVYCATQDLFISVKRRFEELEAWDLRDPLSPRLVWSHRGRKALGKRKYIVVSQQGEHFLLSRYFIDLMLPDGSRAEFDPLDERKYPSKTTDFTVQKIVRDGVTTKMVEMDGHLDGLVMFVGGLSHGMAMPASDAHGFQPNTICFTDDLLGSCASEYGTDNGIFNYEKKTFSSCYYACDDYESRKNYILPPPLWFTPNPN